MVLVKDHLREAVTARDHPVVAAMEVTDLDSAPAEVPTKVAVLETALGVVQVKVLEDSCCQDLAGGVTPNMPDVVGTILGLASRALLDVITVDNLDIFRRIAHCSFRLERPQMHQLQGQLCRVDHRRYHHLWRLRPVVVPRPMWPVEAVVSRGDMMDVPEPQAKCITCPSRKHMHH